VKIGEYIENERGITAPRGFRSAGIHCGIKKAKKDLALVVSEVPAAAAGVFTLNRVAAAPVVVDKEQFRRSSLVRALLVNSGNANAATGERGMQDAWMMVRATAQALGIPESQVLVSSTGVIGQFLPMETIAAGIPEAVTRLTPDCHRSAAEAIMTTDTFAKEFAIQFTFRGTEVSIGGMSKGSGMIAPNMATMLAFITTDVAVAPEVLQHALREATDRSFNRISVDGDTSTNDMVLLLANGLAKNKTLTSISDADYPAFYAALEHVLVRLSQMIVRDGEGATKFVEISVTGAASESVADKAARAIANSSLVKTAIHGEDANWGRILAAVGYSGIAFTPEDVEIAFGAVPILRRNFQIDFSEEAAKEVLSQRDLTITVNLNQGNAAARFWTCDLSKEYVAINANYRT
jgi:glutamate N-acetyltransferase / amino-acid N-acetyltransferase